MINAENLFMVVTSMHHSITLHSVLLEQLRGVFLTLQYFLQVFHLRMT